MHQIANFIIAPILAIYIKDMFTIIKWIASSQIHTLLLSATPKISNSRKISYYSKPTAFAVYHRFELR